MTFEQTIQAMYDNYPCLYQTRAECLNQLFCVIGNGYEWIGGALTDPDGDDAVPLNALTDDKAVQRNLPADRHSRTPRAENWYFVCRNRDGGREIDLCKGFAMLWAWPDDITPDWKAGLLECVAMLLEDSIISQEDLDEEGMPCRTARP